MSIIVVLVSRGSLFPFLPLLLPLIPFLGGGSWVVAPRTTTTMAQKSNAQQSHIFMIREDGGKTGDAIAAVSPVLSNVPNVSILLIPSFPVHVSVRIHCINCFRYYHREQRQKQQVRRCRTIPSYAFPAMMSGICPSPIVCDFDTSGPSSRRIP